MDGSQFQFESIDRRCFIYYMLVGNFGKLCLIPSPPFSYSKLGYISFLIEHYHCSYNPTFFEGWSNIAQCTMGFQNLMDSYYVLLIKQHALEILTCFDSQSQEYRVIVYILVMTKRYHPNVQGSTENPESGITSHIFNTSI